MKKVIEGDEYDELKHQEEDAIPEFKLLKAVLTRAIQDYTGILLGQPRGDREPGKDSPIIRERRRHAKTAEEWLFDDTESPKGTFDYFTFRYICLQLDLDHQVLRKGANHLREFAQRYGQVQPRELYKKRFWPTICSKYTEATILKGVVQCEPRPWFG